MNLAKVFDSGPSVLLMMVLFIAMSYLRSLFDNTLMDFNAGTMH
jgi:hypothetical protein